MPTLKITSTNIPPNADGGYQAPASGDLSGKADIDLLTSQINASPDATKISATRLSDTVSLDGHTHTSSEITDLMTVTTYTHTQSIPDTVWLIPHNLGFFPNVQVVDSGGSLVMGNVEHIDLNTLQVIFTAAFSGKAYLS